MHCVTRTAPAPAARAPVKVALELWELGSAEVVGATYVLMIVLVLAMGAPDGQLFNVLRRDDVLADSQILYSIDVQP